MPNDPTPEEFQAVTLDLIDKVDRQGQDLGAKNSEIEALHRRVRELNDALQVAIAEKQNAEAEAGVAIGAAHRAADEKERAQRDQLTEMRKNREADATIHSLENANANLRVALDASRSTIGELRAQVANLQAKGGLS